MNVRLFVSKNLVALVMVPAIIGAHYTWYKLQHDDRLVSKNERDKLPMITVSLCLYLGCKMFHSLVMAFRLPLSTLYV